MNEEVAMPEQGEISIIDGKKRIWGICKDCGKGRWVQIKYGRPCSDRCRECMIKKNNPCRYYVG